MNKYLTESIYVRSFIKIAHFVPIHQQTWPLCAILVFDWLMQKKSDFLKRFGLLNLYMTGSIYERSFVQSHHFFQIHQQTWPPWAILVSDWLIKQIFMKFPNFIQNCQQTWVMLVSDQLINRKCFFSETAWPNKLVLDRASLRGPLFSHMFRII